MERMIPFVRPSITQAEIAAVTEALSTGQIGGDGKFSQQLRTRLSALLDDSHVILTTSCSDALELAVMVLDLQPGAQVIMPSFTFPSTANAVMRQGAIPVFADIDGETFNIDPAHVESLITESTVGIICVHYAGRPCNMDRLSEIAARHNIWIVEDDAQGLGGYWRQQPLGTLGKIGCISFHATKNLVCGEGGAFVTKDLMLAKKAEIAAEKGTDRSAFLRGEVDRYTWQQIGSSFVLSDLLAALMLAQLVRLEEITQRRLQLWNRYQEGLSALEARGRLRCPRSNETETHNAHCFPVLIDPSIRNQIITLLKQKGIQATSHFEPLHTSPAARRLVYRSGNPPYLPVTDYVSSAIVRLPLFPDLNEIDQDRVMLDLATVLEETVIRR